MATEMRKYVDLTNLTMDAQQFPVVYVKSNIIWRNQEPGFQALIQELEEAPYPGFFLTNQEGDREVRVRWGLNRHCVLHSDYFYDSNGNLYRDVDAKGVGYTRGFPMQFLSVREPEMPNDREMRGILYNDVAEGDRLNTMEMAELDIRLAMPVAHIELLELVNQKGEVVPRQEIGEQLYLDFENVRPTIAVRAMGTTSRVWDLHTMPETNNQNYVKEIIDDVMDLVSLELQGSLSPADYVLWFINTLAGQIGKLHKNNIWTDAMAQIHGGLHNVTLDCRFTDTYHYQTPEKARRSYEALKKGVEEDPSKKDLIKSLYPKHNARERRENNAEGEEEDKRRHQFIANELTRGVDEFYPLGSLKTEVRGRFKEAYSEER